MNKFNHTAHKELWDWLGENPDKSKCDWDGWVLNGGKYEIANSYCFACEYDCKYSGDDDTCDCCSLVWPNEVKCDEGDECDPSLYENWGKEINLQLKSKLAAQIRDLPVRDGVECI